MGGRFCWIKDPSDPGLTRVKRSRSSKGRGELDIHSPGCTERLLLSLDVADNDLRARLCGGHLKKLSFFEGGDTCTYIFQAGDKRTYNHESLAQGNEGQGGLPNHSVFTGATASPSCM